MRSESAERPCFKAGGEEPAGHLRYSLRTPALLQDRWGHVLLSGAVAFSLGLSLLKWKVIPELLEITSRLCHRVHILTLLWLMSWRLGFVFSREEA